MKGYKAFDKNLRCKDFQYEIGQTYEMDEDIECCKRGFHFCKTIADCYKFYFISESTRICKVKAIGKIKTDDGIKYCTNKIKILSEVKNPRIKSNVNKSSTGYCNTGNWNSGNRNSGNWNSGNYNSGGWNSGDWNSGYKNSGDNNNGDRNSGDWNSGYRNSGIMNKGNKNSGDCNSGSSNAGNFNSGSFNSGDSNNGDCNCGDWNKGDCHLGAFNCDTDQKIKMFDKESNWTMKDWHNSRAYIVMLRYPYCGRSENEQGKAIFHETTTEEKQKWWDKLSEDDKNAIKELPNFDADKFYLCTGIRV